MQQVIFEYALNSDIPVVAHAVSLLRAIPIFKIPRLLGDVFISHSTVG